MYSLTAMLEALYHRERTGEGQNIEVSLLESVLTWTGYFPYMHWYGGRLPQRVRVLPVQFEESLARFDGGLVGSLGHEEVAAEPDEIGAIGRQGRRLRDRREGFTPFADGICKARPTGPGLRVLRFRGRETDANVEGLPRPAEGLERGAQTPQGRRLLRVGEEDGLEHRDRFLESVELHQAGPLIEDRRGVRRIEDRGLTERAGRLLVSFQRQERGAFSGVHLRLPRFEAERPIERGDGLLVPTEGLQREAEEVPSLRILGRVAGGPLEGVRGVREGARPILGLRLVQPQRGGRGIRLNRHLERLHRFLVSAEAQEQGGLSAGSIRIVRIEP